MHILIVTPASYDSTKGNRITAIRWATIIRNLGHDVTVGMEYVPGDYDALIALHARKSRRAIMRFKGRHSDRPIVVAMTGTDLHLDLERTEDIKETLQWAKQIILLEPEGAKLLGRKFRKKIRVIYQSAIPETRKPKQLKRWFEVSVLGHLRDVKDPFRIAAASRLLPETSRIKVVHFGEALSSTMKRRAKTEMEYSPRYHWLGPLSHADATRRLARSRLTVLSSRVEGAPSVISEAIVNDVPILTTRIPATIGLLGKDHPGFFEFEDTIGLRNLLHLAETDKAFYRRLLAAGKQLKSKFSPRKEISSFKSLLADLKR